MSRSALSRCWPALLAVVCLAGCRPPGPVADVRGRPLHRQTASLAALGTTFRITLDGSDPGTAAAAISAAAERLAEVDAVLNADRPDSELAALNAAGEGVPVKLSDDLFTVLHQAQRLAAASHGAFDVTAGPYRDLWRQSASSGRVPSGPEFESARLRVGWDKLRLNAIERTATLTVPKMRVDTTGIARGYAADEIFRQLRRHGCERAKVDAGAVIVAGEAPPGRAGWPVRIPDAVADGSRAASVLDLTRTAIAFSPNAPSRESAGAALPSDGPRLIDPLTGRALTDRPAAAVLAGSAAVAESIAAAAPIVGASASQALAAAGGGARVRFLTPGRPLANPGE